MTQKNSSSTDPPVKLERLQKVLARAGVASRRACEDLITQGRVSVDGQLVDGLGSKVGPDAIIEVDGVVVALDAPRRYLLAYKPKGMLTTVSDPFARETVMALIDDEDPGLFPVGRLDRETTGALLFTDDGELANRLIHPRFHVPKTYKATIERPPSQEGLEALRDGIELEDGRTAPAQIVSVEPTADGTAVTLTIHEGKKRQVRRMFTAIGRPVVQLCRVAFGPLTLAGMEPGDVRGLTDEEVLTLSGLGEPSP